MLLILLVAGFACSCSGDDDDEDGGGSGQVAITNITLKSKSGTKYPAKVTIKAYGVDADNVGAIGIRWGSTSACSGNTTSRKGTTSVTVTANLHTNSTTYIRPFLKVSGKSEVQGSVKKVKTPK